MPKLYEYKGFHFFLYSNEHPPPHIHVQKGETLMRIEFVEVGGAVWTQQKEYKPKFSAADKIEIVRFVDAYRNGILSKWQTFVVEKKKPKCEKIGKI